MKKPAYKDEMRQVQDELAISYLPAVCNGISPQGKIAQ